MFNLVLMTEARPPRKYRCTHRAVLSSMLRPRGVDNWNSVLESRQCWGRWRAGEDGACPGPGELAHHGVPDGWVFLFVGEDGKNECREVDGYWAQ